MEGCKKFNLVHYAIVTYFTLMVVHFAVYNLPVNVQEGLKARLDHFNSLIAYSSIFVHKDAARLFGNLLTFALLVSHLW